MIDVEQRVRSYASDVVADCSPDRVTAVRRFESGERHAVYKVSYVDAAGGTSHVVVRVALSDDGAERAQAEREAAVLAKVHGIAAPLLHDFRLESPWFDAPAMCMEFVPGHLGEVSAAAAEDVERLGSVVGLVHGLATEDLEGWFPDTGPAGYRAGRLAQVAAYMPSVRDPLPASVQGRLARAVRWMDESLDAAGRHGGAREDDRLVLLHGDVATGNIIWGPHPILIDWEYARAGEAADEIAYLFSQNGLTAPQRDAFWRGYDSAAGSDGRVRDVRDRVGWWEPVTLLGSSLWWVERWSRRVDADARGQDDPSASRPPSYYFDHAMRRLDRFDELTGGAAVPDR